MPQLQDLNVDWVSLVDRAAVRDPQQKSEPRRFLLWKREGAELPTTAKGGDPVEKSAEELRADLEKAEREHAEMKEALEKAEKERDEALEKAVTIDAEDEPAVKKLVSEGKSRTEAEAIVRRSAEEKKEVNKAELAPEVREALEKAEKDAENARADVAKAQEKAEEASEIAKAEREQRLSREYVGKAEEYRVLPIAKDELGPILRAADEGTPLTKEQGERLLTLLKAADEQIATGDLLKEVGRGGAPERGDAMTKLQHKAEELRKSDSSLTPEQALEKAMKESPELEREYASQAR